MIWSASRVARYRLRATARREWAGYLAIVLVVGILGAVCAIAAGVMVALVLLVGSLVFGASLSNLVSHPAL